MERKAGLKALGLSPRATPAEIEAAYKRRSRELKHKLLNATQPEVIARHRNDLRLLIVMRDTALGRDKTEPRTEQLNISSRRLIRLLQRTSASTLDRPTARSFFGLADDAQDADVVAAYELRKRALIRRYAKAVDNDEVATIRRAQGKLRTVRNFALTEIPG